MIRIGTGIGIGIVTVIVIGGGKGGGLHFDAVVGLLCPPSDGVGGLRDAVMRAVVLGATGAAGAAGAGVSLAGGTVGGICARTTLLLLRSTTMMQLCV